MAMVGISKLTEISAIALAVASAAMAIVGISKLTEISATALAIASAAMAMISLAAAFFSVYSCRRRSRLLSFRIQELESSLKASSEKVASERRGRVRAQQALREALAQKSSDGPKSSRPDSPASYPMSPIGFVQSCFATRNGTPRQPLIVPLSRACLVFDSSRIPADALDGLAKYSHCWVLFVFHLNTDLEKLWKQPSRSKLKAKVRVPTLEGAKVGVLATRSPHRPCPIGLSVAKIEALQGHALMLSGVDLVDENEKISLYPSMDAFQSLVKEVLSCDIRSLSQRCRPHCVITEDENNQCSSLLSEDTGGEPTGVVYHLILERVDISYRIDERLNIMVEKATLVSCASSASKDRYSYSPWREKLVKI